MPDRARGRRRQAPAHGTRARYTSKAEPCRCEACRRANTAYIRRWRGAGPGWENLTLWPGRP